MINKSSFLTSFFIFIAFGLNAQTWKHKVQYSDFDGKYDIVYAFGYGGSSPYENPQFIVRNIDENELFISDLGYTGCDDNKLVIVFDKTRKYIVYGNPSTDNEALFLSSIYYQNEELTERTIYHLLKEIMQSSKMSIRFSNDCSIRDFYYRLDGSTSALTKMFGSKIQSEIKLFDEQQIKKAKALEEEKKMMELPYDIWRFKVDSARAWEKEKMSKQKSMNDALMKQLLLNPRVDSLN